ncbi:MAG: hypothetical protein QW429_04155 [Thermoprotei archaeon]
MVSKFKTLRNSLIIVAVLLAFNLAVCVTTGSKVLPTISLYSFLEGAVLMAIAGLADLGDSAIGSAIRRGLFRTGEQWSYTKYRGNGIKLTLLVSGLILFLMSIIMVK